MLNALLKTPEMSDAAVIINEFGDIGIDHLLVETADDNVFEMASGCLCCTIRGDLVDTLSDLIERRDNGSIKAFNRVANRNHRVGRSSAGSAYHYESSHTASALPLRGRHHCC